MGFSGMPSASLAGKMADKKVKWRINGGNIGSIGS